MGDGIPLGRIAGLRVPASWTLLIVVAPLRRLREVPLERRSPPVPWRPGRAAPAVGRSPGRNAVVRGGWVE